MRLPRTHQRPRLGVAAAIALVLSVTVPIGPVQATEVVQRVGGSDRVATAVAVAHAGWDSAPRVLLATSRNYPDAVAAAAYAASLDAPLLLTEPGALSPAVATALRDLGASHVTLLGGTAALFPRVRDDVEALGLATSRLSGGSRFGTAAVLAERVADRGPVEVVALALGDRADGVDAWPDALAAASLAGLDAPVPTLLTRRADLPSETRTALRDLNPQRVLILGGTAAIPDAIVNQVASMGFEVERLKGPNRFATSVAVAQAAMAGEEDQGTLDGDRVVIVSGEGFADALGAGALAARNDAPLLLVPSGRLADSVDTFVRGSGTDFESAIVVGGTAVVSDFVKQELHAAMTGEPRPVPPAPSCPPNSSPDCKYTYHHPISTWEDLADCESHGQWDINTGNGYYGGLQFSLGTWRNVGGSGYPHENSKWEQIHRGEILQERSGWGQWPHCSRELGLR